MNYEKEKAYAQARLTRPITMPQDTAPIGLCPAPARDSIAELSIRRLYDALETLDNLSLALHDRLYPVCRPSAEETQCAQPEECWPEYYERIRGAIRTINKVNERVDSLLMRLEV